MLHATHEGLKSAPVIPDLFKLIDRSPRRVELTGCRPGLRYREPLSCDAFPFCWSLFAASNLPRVKVYSIHSDCTVPSGTLWFMTCSFSSLDHFNGLLISGR